MLHELTDLRRDQGFTYSEGGTHKETLCPQSKAKVEQETSGTRSQSDRLRIRKTDAVIA